MTLTQERTDLIHLLDRHRGFLRFTVQNLTDEQAASQPIPSTTLSLGGLIKHVAATQRGWLAFATDGAEAMQAEPNDWENGFRMAGGETLEGLLDEYEKVAALTNELAATADLDVAHALPEAPWFEAGATWSVRRVLLHIIAETAQHSGHADLLREAIDGQKTMG
ncbi:putative damage-inducible protein DinB [Catenuloplanes nepalensis]|uniref:Damage-inducible protein DinB n=1 Tax=Catenuloplanes nepalensis TaxID=587533 RepID=A0ABT9MLG1_9ACTN|nr:DinB family protein [Catenuloplanes nepalensis]MDP9792255.1 putative damage-inducible protein DinB [Catenuloplanes nepalensis]